MEDMSEDREDRGEDNGAGEKPEDEDSPDEDSDSGRAAGPSWSRYARLATRAGLDLLGTVFALAAFAVALADGPPWLATVFAVLSIWAAFQSVGLVGRPARPLVAADHRGRRDPVRAGLRAARPRATTGTQPWSMPWRSA